jgi:hypothetical protein
MQGRVAAPVIVGYRQMPGFSQDRFQLLGMVRAPAKAESEQDAGIVRPEHRAQPLQKPWEMRRSFDPTECSGWHLPVW